MKHLVATVMMATISSLSINAMAINKNPIKDRAALEMETVFKRLRIQADRMGNDDTGFYHVRRYFFKGMECWFGDSSRFAEGKTGTCYFEKVKSIDDLNLIRTIFRSEGLNEDHPLFR